MREKGKLTQIFVLDAHFPLFLGYDQDLPDIGITSVLTTLMI